jgi:hydroxyacylglutathione hydrolase
VNITCFELTPFMSNCFVVEDGGEALVIDPGEAAPELLRALDGLRVTAVVNTHAHCDHCGGNADLCARLGAPLALHPDDLPLLQVLTQQAAMFGWTAPASPDPGISLRHGDTLAAGSARFEVRHTPGHAPGHVILAGGGVVFAGDVLFAGSIGRTDLPGGDYDTLLDSIRTQILTLPDTTTVYSGHGPATTVGVERRTNPFLAGL